MTSVKRDGAEAPTNDASKKTKMLQTSLLTHFAKRTSPRKSNSQADIVPESNNKRDVLPATDKSSQSQSPTSPPSPVKINLTVEEQTLFSLELTQIPSGWLLYLQVEFKKPYFKKLKEFLQGEYERKIQTFPPPDQIYSWARLCDFETVKVVIIGQDPYHNDHQAMGLCFSVPKTIIIPPSLVNIYKELADDIEGFKVPKHGDLSGWARQGVLLLNTSLTVRAHQPASHAGRGWEQFTDAVIRAVNVYRKNVVFILWGNHAQKKLPMIDRSKHLALTGVHPSPLSASRGFFGCRHFSKTNQYLASKGIPLIDWNIE